jgi:hypothetical protein
MEANNGEGKIEDVIQTLEKELVKLRAQRASISSRIASISQIALRLKRLCKSAKDLPSPGRDRRPGVTKACRRVLMEARGVPLTIQDVFRAIQTRLAPDILGHKDPRASVATILKRLVEYGEVETLTNSEGKRAFRRIDNFDLTTQSYELILSNSSPSDRFVGSSAERILDSAENLSVERGKKSQ